MDSGRTEQKPTKKVRIYGRIDTGFYVELDLTDEEIEQLKDEEHGNDLAHGILCENMLDALRDQLDDGAVEFDGEWNVVEPKEKKR